MTNAETIYLARVKAGLNQSQLATLAGVSQCAVSRVENGKVKGSNGPSLQRVLGALEAIQENSTRKAEPQ